MFYLIIPTNVQCRKGGGGGGARHMSASALAQFDGGNNVVIKVSEDVCKSGIGEVDVFFGQQKPVKIPVPKK